MRASFLAATILSLPLGGRALLQAREQLACTCPAPETVTVTETFGGSSEIVQSTGSSTEVPTTSTELQIVTVTDTITVMASSTSASVKEDGPGGTVYAYSVSSGHTVWAGATPESVGPYHIVFSTVTVYPTSSPLGITASGSSGFSLGAATTTEYSTIFSTETITVSGVNASISTASSTTANVPPKPSQSMYGTSAPYENATSSSLADTVLSSHKHHLKTTPHVSHHKSGQYNATVVGHKTHTEHRHHNYTTSPAATTAASTTCNTTETTITRVHTMSKTVTLLSTPAATTGLNTTSYTVRQTSAPINTTSVSSASGNNSTTCTSTSTRHVYHNVTHLPRTSTGTLKPINFTSLAGESTTVSNISLPASATVTSMSSTPASHTSLITYTMTLRGINHTATLTTMIPEHSPMSYNITSPTGEATSFLTPGSFPSTFSLLSIFTWSMSPSTAPSSATDTSAATSSLLSTGSVPTPLPTMTTTEMVWPTLSSYGLNTPVGAVNSTPAASASIYHLVPVKRPYDGHSSGQVSSLAKRSMGQEVYATINGELVSWVNNYAGDAFTTLATSSGTAAPTGPLSTHLPPVPAPSVNATTTTAAASVSSTTPYPSFNAPTDCPSSELGNFVIGFDDLPTYGEPANKTFYPPIRSPYHHLMWSDGWSYAPPPPEQFVPVSGHQLGVFLVNSSANVHSQNYTGPIPSSGDVNGMFGAGPNYAQSAFWFNAKGLYVGCPVPAGHNCKVQINGWKYDAAIGQSCKEAYQQFMVLRHGNNTQLQYLELDSTFVNLSAFQIVATDAETRLAVSYYVDNIALTWSNDTCAAAQQRNDSL